MKKIVISLSLIMSLQADYLLDTLLNTIPAPQDFAKNFESASLRADIPAQHRIFNNSQAPLLFEQYPSLEKSISYVSLGNLPTPLRLLENISEQFQTNVYVKDDGRTAYDAADAKQQLFGGNKVRKLEFLLADALAHDAEIVMTFGCAGSNHALATATYAKELNLECMCLLLPQKSEDVVQRNLLLQETTGSALCYYPARAIRNAAAYIHALDSNQFFGKFPYVIPVGGSNHIGALGYVNAAFELKKQIEERVMPEPDYIFVPVGSAGTISGLLVGCKLAGLKSIIKGIAVEPKDFEPTVRKLCQKINDFLCTYDDSIPRYDWQTEMLDIAHQFAGNGYGIFTNEGIQALELIQNLEGITLDGVYSAKACSGMLDFLNKEESRNKTVLFWNTFCGLDFSEKLADVDYHSLPAALQRYFEA